VDQTREGTRPLLTDPLDHRVLRLNLPLQPLGQELDDPVTGDGQEDDQADSEEVRHQLAQVEDLPPFRESHLRVLRDPVWHLDLGDHRRRRICVMRQSSSSQMRATKMMVRSGMVVPNALVIQASSPNARGGAPPTTWAIPCLRTRVSRSARKRRSTAAACLGASGPTASPWMSSEIPVRALTEARACASPLAHAVTIRSSTPSSSASWAAATVAERTRKPTERVT